MKLYLSSYKLGNEPKKLQGLVGGNKKAAIIANALDFSTDIERKKASEQKQIEALTELGLIPEMLDLRDFFGNKENLQKKLEEYGLLWVLGGNTFLLRSAMRQSGLDEILIDYAKRQDKKDFVYAGYSAGVCILAPTLKGIDLVDEPEKVKEIYNTETIWEGLSLIDYSIAPHYQSDHPESDLVENAVRYFQQYNLPFKPLRDGEVIIRDTLQ